MKGAGNVTYYNDSYKYNTLYAGKPEGMHVVKRTIVFCIAIAILPAALIILPLYLKHTVFADVVYKVAESDIVQIRDGISTIFCERHTLKMNTSFNAFQLSQIPDRPTQTKHIRLFKSITLPDDTLEYWGFYLMKGATVALKVCSRYDGSRILVVRGERNLKTCGLMEHNQKKYGANFNTEHSQVKITFETAAEIVTSENHKSEERPGKRHHPKFIDQNIDTDLNHGGEDTSDVDSDFFKNEELLDEKFSGTAKHIQNTNKMKTDTPNSETDNDHYQKNITSNIQSDKVAANNHRNKEQQKRHHKNHHDNASHTGKKRKIHSDTIKESVHHHQTMSKVHSGDPAEARKKRDTILDGGIHHGGNARNFTDKASESTSSFENSLLKCYDGQILLAQSFDPSPECRSVQYLQKGRHLVSTHEVVSDGYYYYIFYSDNDMVKNDIHAIFDIKKPTFANLHANISKSKECINTTECNFPIKFWSDEVVILEVPTRDGIEHEEDDISYLVSTCTPRMAVYVIFPVAVLFSILVFAFI